MKLEPTQYRIETDNPDLRDTRIESRGPSAWVIHDIAFVLNKQKEWVYESLPSSRTEEFIEQTRFKTPEEALEFLEKCLQGNKDEV